MRIRKEKLLEGLKSALDIIDEHNTEKSAEAYDAVELAYEFVERFHE